MDLIIRIRLETLKNNLAKIRCILESVKDRRAEIDRLSDDLKRAAEKLKFVGKNIYDVRATSQNTFAEKKIDDSLMNLLKLAEAEALSLRELLGNIASDISAIQRRWTPLDKSFEAAFEASLKEDLDERIGASSKKIDRDIDALDAVERGEDRLEQAWCDYNEIMSEQSQLIFLDYVEFLGGLALRYAGLDEGICRIADELMRSCGSFGRTHWSALTIPASQEAMTLARSIRMRFPEWTIWAVPLTAHEFGHVVISGNSRLEEYINKQYPQRKKKTSKGRQDMLVCLADAFATYVMGPAYACSVILLRFNPLGAYQDKSKNPADAKRAHIVLSMLEKMELDPNVSPYGDIPDKLRTEWDAALTQAKAQVPDSWNQEVERLDAWSNRFFDELSRSYPNSRYEGTLWQNTLEALEQLLNDENPSDQLKGNEEWRDVLNAAWACRVNKSHESQRVAMAAPELWKLIEDKKPDTPDLKERRISQTGVPAAYIPQIRANKKYGQQ